MTFHYTKAEVSNRGIPDDDFLTQMVNWGKIAAESIFAVNNEPHDVMNQLRPILGPWEDMTHRRCAMLEMMRVLAGFESSWSWAEGVDTTNPTSNTPETMEAGAWQVSYNSRNFGEDLKKLCKDHFISNGTQFQKVTKSGHEFAMEYIARLTRHTINHNGPLKRHEVDPWLSRDAMNEFRSLIESELP